MDNARRRLILFPLPLQGHINPMLQLANILYNKGFSITIVHAKFNSPNPKNHPHFTFRPIDDGIDAAAGGGEYDLMSLLTALNEGCVEPFREALVELLGDGSPENADCAVVADAILHFAGGVCRSLKIPRIVLRTGGACSFLAFAAFPLLLEKGYLPIQESRLDETVNELAPLRVKDLPAIETPHPENLYRVVENMVREAKSSSGLIFNTFEELEESSLVKLRQDFHIPIFPIGPFHKHFSPSPSTSNSLVAKDRSSISWLKRQSPKSVVYVSFGSIAAMEEETFLEIAQGLADARHPFLWVVRPGLIRGHEWVEPLPTDFLTSLDTEGLIVRWAPQMDVLAHPSVGVFWTHGGWNSTLEGACEGVPMICSPFFTDQRVNARFASHVLGIGLELELGLGTGLGREKVGATIRKAMEDKEFGQEVREKALALKGKASSCLECGGSSYEHLEKLVRYIDLL